MTRSCLSIILAAGEGKRMASSLPKVLHPLAGLPMLGHVMQTAEDAGSDQLAVVVGNQAELVADHVRQIKSSASLHVQQKRLGTAHAVLAAKDAIQTGYDDVIILNGDAPLIQPQTLAIARDALADGADIVVLGFQADDPTGYGRMIVVDDKLVAIREQRDASVEEKSITYCNSGIIGFRGDNILNVLQAIGNENNQGEYYLTDCVEIAGSMDLNVQAREVPFEETLGVNDRIQLADVEALWQDRKRYALLLSGVSMTAPQTVVFSHDTTIGPDTVIEPYVVFGQGVTVESGAVLRSFSHFEGATIGSESVVGPYARLRPGSNLGAGTKIGNFVETKNANVADGAKINHLSYVGDADVGTQANIGAGTITCNYDGVNKHRTVIGEHSFIGTNTSLVAPVRVGDHAMTAAGSVVSKDVPDSAMAIERSPQRNIDGMAAKLRKRNLAIKAAKSN